MAPPPVPTFDPDDVRRVADEVLSRSEFDEPGKSILQRIIDWIIRQLDRIFGGDPDSSGVRVGGGGGGSRVLTILLLVVALVAVVLVVRTVARTWARRRPVPEEADLEVDVTGRRTAAGWDDLARRLEADGRWKDAMRARFGALVERLVEAGVVDDVPGRTTGEYRLEVRQSVPEAGEDFAAAAELFDRAWYGDLPTGPEEAERFGAGAERVLAAVGSDR